MLNKKIISIILILTIIFSISANSLTAFAKNAENQEKAEISDGMESVPDDSNDKEENTASDVNMFDTSENEVALMSSTVSFAGGSGTEEDPYQVSTPEQLNEVRNNLDKYFIQINDIDMSEAMSEGGAYYNSGVGWTPIGDDSTKFAGYYDGAGYTITGLYSKAKYTGLFGYVNECTIKNVNLTGTIVGGKNAYAGGIVAYNNKGNVTNCSFDGTISTTNSYVGGIVGNNSGTVTNCINNADITASENYAGGVIGYNASSSDITGCYNYGNIVSSNFAGGIVGSNQNAKISHCGNNGNIMSTEKVGTQVGYGGIAGKSDKNITQCYNIGDVTSVVTRSISSSTCCAIGVGGIVGFYNGSTISDCFNTGKISSLYICGDIVGSGAALSGWMRITTGKIYDVTPASSVLTIRNCYNSYSNSTNNFYGYNASGYSFDYGYQANACRVSNIITVSVSNSYNINADSDTNIIQLTESEIKQKENFAGFDFDSVWDISPNINDGMPYLRGVGNLQPTIQLGDVNGDNEIDFRDAQLIIQYEVGLTTLTDNEKAMADVNGDGEVDFRDAQLILKYEAGLITSF